MLTCALFNEQTKGPVLLSHMISLGKTKFTSEKGLLYVVLQESIICQRTNYYQSKVQTTQVWHLEKYNDNCYDLRHWANLGVTALDRARLGGVKETRDAFEQFMHSTLKALSGYQEHNN